MAGQHTRAQAAALQLRHLGLHARELRRHRGAVAFDEVVAQQQPGAHLVVGPRRLGQHLLGELAAALGVVAAGELGLAQPGLELGVAAGQHRQGGRGRGGGLGRRGPGGKEGRTQGQGRRQQAVQQARHRAHCRGCAAHRYRGWMPSSTAM